MSVVSQDFRDLLSDLNKYQDNILLKNDNGNFTIEKKATTLFGRIGQFFKKFLNQDGYDITKSMNAFIEKLNAEQAKIQQINFLSDQDSFLVLSELRQRIGDIANTTLDKKAQKSSSPKKFEEQKEQIEKKMLSLTQQFLTNVKPHNQINSLEQFKNILLHLTQKEKFYFDDVTRDLLSCNFANQIQAFDPGFNKPNIQINKKKFEGIIKLLPQLQCLYLSTNNIEGLLNDPNIDELLQNEIAYRVIRNDIWGRTAQGACVTITSNAEKILQRMENEDFNHMKINITPKAFLEVLQNPNISQFSGRLKAILTVYYDMICNTPEFRTLFTSFNETIQKQIESGISKLHK